MKLTSGAIVVTLALIAGCQSTPPAQPSGFLGDYSQLQPAPDRVGVMLYVDRNFDFRPYTKLRLLPPQVLVTPVPGEPPPDPAVIARIRTQMHESLQRYLAPTYQLVDQAGPDVLTVRSAITGLEAATPPKHAIDVLPVKALVNRGREAVGTAPHVAEMSGEVEVLAPDGKRVIAGTASRKGDQRLPQGDQITWESLASITDYWARNVRKRLDQLRGVTPPVAMNVQ
ncbi:DUF3313 domain-containing protein [Massilia horti]|uniref:DUF3313 domain-containing protein n=1 Tax=Massilia horti TaxID=2562153 RepID=A0A4Y9SX41_9BURK|nr:DUF3313 domain-containing protein [Massilia horti]TFW31189.1 DUF3313 domain-containing protein [Massilia horti]